MSRFVTAGSYIVNATADFSAAGSDVNEVPVVRCELTAAGVSISKGSDSPASYTRTYYRGSGSVALTGAYSPSQAATVTLSCSQLFTDDVDVTNAYLTLTQVNSIGY